MSAQAEPPAAPPPGVDTGPYQWVGALDQRALTPLQVPPSAAKRGDAGRDSGLVPELAAASSTCQGMGASHAAVGMLRAQRNTSLLPLSPPPAAHCRLPLRTPCAAPLVQIKELGHGAYGTAVLMQAPDGEMVAVKLLERGAAVDRTVEREILNHRQLSVSALLVSRSMGSTLQDLQRVGRACSTALSLTPPASPAAAAMASGGSR